jgi:hypothetical protein
VPIEVIISTVTAVAFTYPVPYGTKAQPFELKVDVPWATLTVGVTIAVSYEPKGVPSMGTRVGVGVGVAVGVGVGVTVGVGVGVGVGRVVPRYVNKQLQEL